MQSIDPKLVKLAFQAIRSPERWQQLLQHIITTTPAQAAMITLRDKVTCQIVNDDALEREYHSPLIQGFPLEAVVYYLEELRTIDPWADAQIRHYPHRPTIMSTVCHPNDVEDRRFFGWLEKGGLRDTIVFELDRVPGHWTSINLFLERLDTKESAELLEYCEVHFDLLRESWRSSQHVIKYQQSGQAALNQLAAKAIPACIVTPSGEVFFANEAFHELGDAGVAKISRPSGRVSICKNANFWPDALSNGLQVLHHDAVDIDINISASPFGPDPLYAQKKGNYWLLRFNNTLHQLDSSASQVYSLDILTHQERLLFDAISLGASVQDAGKKIGIQRSRAFDVWAEIKLKLDIENAHALRGVLAIQTVKNDQSES